MNTIERITLICLGAGLFYWPLLAVAMALIIAWGVMEMLKKDI